MRTIALAVLSLGFLTACEDSRVESLFVDWMEWQTEVQHGKPVEVLIMGILGCGSKYVRRYEVDKVNSAIVFSPYEIVPEQPCASFAPVLYADTVNLVGLAARAYALRSGSRVFGELVITTETPSARILKGAGRASAVRDPDGCLRLRPLGVYPEMPLESSADTTSEWTSPFVTGYIIQTDSPVCGKSTVFRLLSRE